MECNHCLDFYVGQTVNNFHERWNGHRKVWRDNFDKNKRSKDKFVKQSEKNCKIKFKNTDDKRLNNHNDENALFMHYQQKHPNVISGTNNQLADLYSVFFVEKSAKNRLDAAEGYWISKLNAGINIARTIIPKFK